MVATSTTPLFLLDGALNVLALSASACRAFKLDTGTVRGGSVFDMGEGEWNSRRFHSLLDAVATGGAEIADYQMDLACEGGLEASS